MPWSDQSGGGGWKGGGGGNNGGGGPWGSGPTGGGGPSGNSPDLEEIIRKGQERIKNSIPGGSGGFSPLALGGIGIVLIVLWGLKCFYTIQPEQLGVELRFGKPKEEVSTPGLHFLFWPLETVEIATVVERQVEIGVSRRGSENLGLMLSGDQNIVDVQFSVLYEVFDPGEYLFNVAAPDELVTKVAESAMREVVGRRPAQDIYADDRAGIADQVKRIVQTSLDGYGAGIQVNTVSIEEAAPPNQVADAFDEVQRAEQDRNRFVEEANQYSNKQLGQARGESAQIRENAAAYKNRVVQEATGEAQRFTSVYNEYVKAPEVTRKRLFLETMEKVLRDSNKVIVEQGNGQGVVPYLPLNELNRQRGGN